MTAQRRSGGQLPGGGPPVGGFAFLILLAVVIGLTISVARAL